MSQFTLGIQGDEVAWPERRAEPHIASGSGWEEPSGRGGGHVPDRNPWKESPHIPNPAQDGSTLDRSHGER